MFSLLSVPHPISLQVLRTEVLQSHHPPFFGALVRMQLVNVFLKLVDCSSLGVGIGAEMNTRMALFLSIRYPFHCMIQHWCVLGHMYTVVELVLESMFVALAARTMRWYR